jgi:hypothetical protein
VVTVEGCLERLRTPNPDFTTEGTKFRRDVNLGQVGGGAR